MENNPHNPQKRLADLIITLPGVVWKYSGQEQRFTLISDHARVLTGYQTERFLRDVQLFFQQVHPDDVGQLQPLWQKLQQGHEPFTWRFRLHSEGYPDGWRWLQTVYARVR